jgi:hypothetical protein
MLRRRVNLASDTRFVTFARSRQAMHPTDDRLSEFATRDTAIPEDYPPRHRRLQRGLAVEVMCGSKADCQIAYAHIEERPDYAAYFVPAWDNHPAQLIGDNNTACDNRVYDAVDAYCFQYVHTYP